MTKFQIITLIIFGFLGLAGVLAFSGLLDQRTSSGVGSITIWGTLPETQISNSFAQLEIDKTINFTVKYEGYTEAAFDRALIEALASGKGPDAILLSQDLVTHYRDKIYVMSPESYPTRFVYDTFIDGASIFVTPEGLLGYPLVVDPIVAYWNKDMFARASIPVFPRTWEDLVALIPALTIADDRGGIAQSAVALGGYSNITNAKDIVSSLLLQAGQSIATWTNEGTARALLTEGAAPALSFYAQFSDPARNTYSWNSALDSSRRMFEANKLAIYFGRAHEYDDIRTRNPHLNFDVAVMPQRESARVPAVYGKIYAFSVLKASPNLTSAFTAGSILSGASVLKAVSDGARLAPARRDLLAAGTTDPILTVFNRAALIARGWLDPDPAASDMIFKEAMSALLSGQSADNEVTEYIAGELNKLLEE